jgi:hypothetical protein
MKSPARDGRKFLSSLAGLLFFVARLPSHKWLGYFQMRPQREMFLENFHCNIAY